MDLWLSLVIYAIEIVGIIIIGLLLLPVVFQMISFMFDATYKKQFQKFSTYGVEQPFANAVFHTEIIDNGNLTISAGEKVLFTGGATFHAGKQWYTTSKALSPGILLTASDQQNAAGEDDLGAFEVTSCRLRSPDEAVDCVVAIRIYRDQPAILFEMQFPAGLGGVPTGQLYHPCAQFPCFKNESACRRIMTWRDDIFCPPSYTAKGTGAPVIFFDHALNSIVVGPATNHLVAITRVDKRVRCGIEGLVNQIPNGYAQSTLMLFGKGINDQVVAWARLVRQINGWENRDPSHLAGNAVADKIGVFWGNGAHYYYNKGPFRTYEETIAHFFDVTDGRGIPLGYAQLDSWFYVKTMKVMWKYPPFKWLGKLIGGATFGGTFDWVPNPAEFPSGLGTLMQKIGRPYAAHNRWWSAQSPRIVRYNDPPALVHGNDAVPLSPAFWGDLFALHVAWGLTVYEQDWVKTTMSKVPALRQDVHLMPAWLDAIAGGAAKHDIAMLYCMATPSVLLHSMQYGKTALLARAAGDYNARWPKKYIVPFYTQASMLCFAAGLGPYLDAVNTSTARSGLGREKHPDLLVKLVNFGTGPVPAGDAEDAIDKDLLMGTCLADGTILKADKPLTPLDIMYVPHQKPYLLYSYSKKADWAWYYIMAIVLWPRRAKEYQFTLKELGLGIAEACIIYAEKADTLRKVDPRDMVETPSSKDEHEVFVIAPELLPGVALIGLKDKFVTASNRAIPSVSVEGSTIKVDVLAPAGDIVTLLWYAEKDSLTVTVDSTETLLINRGEKRLEIPVAGAGWDTLKRVELTLS